MSPLGGGPAGGEGGSVGPAIISPADTLGLADGRNEGLEGGNHLLFHPLAINNNCFLIRAAPLAN